MCCNKIFGTCCDSRFTSTSVLRQQLHHGYYSLNNIIHNCRQRLSWLLKLLWPDQQFQIWKVSKIIGFEFVSTGQTHHVCWVDEIVDRLAMVTNLKASWVKLRLRGQCCRWAFHQCAPEQWPGAPPGWGNYPNQIADDCGIFNIINQCTNNDPIYLFICLSISGFEWGPARVGEFQPVLIIVKFSAYLSIPLR